jgi:hypothetical protein
MTSALRNLLLIATLAACGALGACGGTSSGPVVPPVDVTPAPGVSGPAWWSFGRNAQHTAEGAIATQDLNRIVWKTPIDLAPQFTGDELLAHYGSPVISDFNTVLLPVKTGSGGGFRVEARSGVNGGLIWKADTDYVMPSLNGGWLPSYNLALTTTGSRLYAPGAGGKLLVRDAVDSATGALTPLAFYGTGNYTANTAAYDGTVFINTPLTVDSAGNVFFGFIVTGTNPSGLSSGIARVDASGVGSWVSASTIAGDAQIQKVATNSAPAVSNDLSTVYVAVNAPDAQNAAQKGYLVALDSTTLAVKSRVLLLDPATAAVAQVPDNGTASPTVGPDGDVFFGVLESNNGAHHFRGWLLHFDSTLGQTLIPGGFGWDDTASVVPASMVASYTGSSSYLVMSKYNEYATGKNRIAVLDPKATEADPISGKPIMNEVVTILGATPEGTGVFEWCVNTAAIDPLTHSVLVNSEDGSLYRWDLSSNTLTQHIQLSGGLGEAYTPTAIGADGTVYAVNDSVLFALGK